MLKIEKEFCETITRIMNDGCDESGGNVRPMYEDGQKAYTNFITQNMTCYDIGAGEFPITALRPIVVKKAIGEMLWIYQDMSNDLELLKSKYYIGWWDEWDIGNRTIGQAYGAVVKRYDLTNRLLDGLKKQPFSRRHIINLYQFQDMSEVHGLDPCAYETIWSVRKDKAGEMILDMTLIQRSSDYIVAGHINKMQYVAFMMAVARHLGYKLGKFCHYVQNLHIYHRHFSQANEILRRYQNELMQLEMVRAQYVGMSDDEIAHELKRSASEEKCFLLQTPKLVLNPEKNNFWDIRMDDFTLVDYKPMAKVDKLELAI